MSLLSSIQFGESIFSLGTGFDVTEHVDQWGLGTEMKSHDRLGGGLAIRGDRENEEKHLLLEHLCHA